jgi:hypothetical protein
MILENCFGRKKEKNKKKERPTTPRSALLSAPAQLASAQGAAHPRV